ncbi:MAG: acyl-CoA dehydrogenase [Planctomycetales bacterium]|nr:acyl-CoA dehydrogenase [Planctomycetales bacterium]NIM08007.1 acyl-CoA dehydrogenase [Planctomycetales bacterium]NIN07489.1 acyl-CoA dehydrogenase [Planctomycetales bacterium]NIN76594.1 acyl-CoA dehydrogenase [Planctomycetales bacterium]NIO33784.1 acyl-CoA dehydrogenase [Planctomycetales bacterium]
MGPETPAVAAAQKSFAETALELGGKSADEARRTGVIDTADDQVESLFAAQYQTVNSPAHRAVWDRPLPVHLFQSEQPSVPEEVRRVMDDSLEVVARHRRAGTLLDQNQKIPESVLRDLADAGYWGLLVSREYGGSGAQFAAFAPFLTQMAMYDPTIAGLASVHGCIGAVDPVRTFGNPEQKQRFLPDLASGRKLSAFALTEPWAGSDLTALRTRAERKNGHFLVNGEKLFITNVVPGRTIGLVCLIEDRPAVLIVDLPEEENDQFQLRKYGLWALKHTYNQGIIFRDFPVPAENLLTPPKGDGLTIAYHGLNLGRVSLCANAAGTMRLMMASMIPWAHFRRTYGEFIAKRELVQRRLGALAGMIVGCDALVAWCAGLIDQGYRGEMECIVAKIFGSEMQKDAAVELFMKTHGGRSFLHGHMFGDNVHEFLAPCIYEGEGEMLGMAFFKSLVKNHGREYFEPIGRALQQAGIRKPNLANPAHLWALKAPMLNYGRWFLGQKFQTPARADLPDMPPHLKQHAQFAARRLQKMPLKISQTMSKHQLALADRQCRMAALSAKVQNLLAILCTTLYAARHDDEVIHAAANVLCLDLTRQVTGGHPSDGYFRAVNQLGRTVLDGGFQSVAGVDTGEILMNYQNR